VPENAITAMLTARNLSKEERGTQILLTDLKRCKNHIPFLPQKKTYSWKNNN
jgi:hypothetical protein